MPSGALCLLFMKGEKREEEETASFHIGHDTAGQIQLWVRAAGTEQLCWCFSLPVATLYNVSISLSLGSNLSYLRFVSGSLL